jgi:hypothetical protein
MVVGGGPERGGEEPGTGGAWTWEEAVRDLARWWGATHQGRRRTERKKGVRRVQVMPL